MILKILVGVAVIGIIVVIIDCILIGKHLKKMNKDNKKFKDKYKN